MRPLPREYLGNLQRFDWMTVPTLERLIQSSQELTKVSWWNLKVGEIGFYRKMSSSALFDLLADDHIACCDRSDAKAARLILKERNYKEGQIETTIKQHKKRWYPKTYYFVCLLRWVIILSAVAMFVFNWGHIDILFNDIFDVFYIVVLSIFICVASADKLYRGTRHYVYQGFPAPMNFIEICTLMDFSGSPLILIMGAVNVFTYANIFVFIYIVASFV